MLDELVLHVLLQIRPLSAQLRQTIDHVNHEMEAVQVILHPHVERGRDGALLLVAPDVQVLIGSAIVRRCTSQVSMKTEDDVLVRG